METTNRARVLAFLNALRSGEAAGTALWLDKESAGAVLTYVEALEGAILAEIAGYRLATGSDPDALAMLSSSPLYLAAVTLGLVEES